MYDDSSWLYLRWIVCDYVYGWYIMLWDGYDWYLMLYDDVYVYD
jgi:hypothetical protein